MSDWLPDDWPYSASALASVPLDHPENFPAVLNRPSVERDYPNLRRAMMLVCAPTVPPPSLDLATGVTAIALALDNIQQAKFWANRIATSTATTTRDSLTDDFGMPTNAVKARAQILSIITLCFPEGRVVPLGALGKCKTGRDVRKLVVERCKAPE